MRFIESICLQDGLYHNLDLHQRRMDSVFREFAPEENPYMLSDILPLLHLDGCYKVRLVYDLDTEDIDYNISYIEYQPKKIESLEVISSPPFSYAFKYEERKRINDLMGQSKADDIIISIDNHLTDGSYFNLAFWDGKSWFTPDTPLLDGVKRRQLLNEKKISEASITISDLHSFEKVSLINAMLDLEEIEISLDKVLR